MNDKVDFEDNCAYSNGRNDHFDNDIDGGNRRNCDNDDGDDGGDHGNRDYNDNIANYDDSIEATGSRTYIAVAIAVLCVTIGMVLVFLYWKPHHDTPCLVSCLYIIVCFINLLYRKVKIIHIIAKPSVVMV